MRDCNSGAVLGGFLAGAIIGGAIALLFAPRSGAETRGMIRDYVDDEMDTLKDKAASARDYVEGEVERYKRRARRAAAKLEDMVEDAADSVENGIGTVKGAARRTLNSVK